MSDDDFTAEFDDACPDGRGIRLEDFLAFLPMRSSYIFKPTGELWPGTSVNARLPRMPVLTKAGIPKLNENGNPVTITATKWLDANQAVVQMIWCPGYPELIENRMATNGGWVERPDVTCFNLYRPPHLRKLGDANKAGPWLAHVHKIYPEDGDHAINWLAHRVQKPGEKINHALVMGGAQGIGKDTMLEPLKYAVGPWNFHEVNPTQLIGAFNNFAKSVVLRVSEARDLGETNRFTFYDHTKVYTAAPPDVLRVNEKFTKEYYVFNVIGFIITTNHKSDGIYLPPDDRRHYVMWSILTKKDFPPGYWNRIWNWYQNENGFEHVAAYLQAHDLSRFDPKEAPRQTSAWQDIVSVNQAPEDAEIADVLDKLGRPEAVSLLDLLTAATGETAEWLAERKSKRVIRHRLERCGYIAVHNSDADDGYWSIKGMRRAVYANITLSEEERIKAARRLCAKNGPPK